MAKKELTMYLNVTEVRKIIGRLSKGDDLLGALTSLCQDLGITLEEVKAIGAVSRAGSAIITRTHGSTNGLT
jgi:predicted DNA-binding protein with PD1-like motif